MRTLLGCLLVLLLSSAPALAQTPAPPEGWLATIRLRHPIALLDNVETMLDRFEVDWNGRESLELAKDQRLGLAGGMLVLGVAAPADAPDALYPFVMTPTPVEQVVRLLNGEMTGDICVGSVAGYEVAARRVHGVTYIVPLAHQSAFDSKSTPRKAAESVRGDVTLAISQQGLVAMRQRVATLKAQFGHRNRVVLNEMGWPPSRKWVTAAIASNPPLIEKVEELFKQVQIGVTLDGVGEVSVDISGQLYRAADTYAPVEPVQLPALNLEPIVRIQGPPDPGVLHTLSAVLLAYSQGRPDEVQLKQYPADSYAQVASKALAAVDQIRSVDAALLSRKPDDPFQSNRIALLRVADEALFVAATTESAQAWNQLIEDSRTRQRLTMQAEQVQLSPNLPLSTRFTTDVAAGLFPPANNEVRRILERYYGPDGLHVMHLQPLGDGRVLLGDIPQKDFVELLERLRKAEALATKKLSGAWDLGRYAAWQNAMLADYTAGAIGFKPPVKLGPALVEFSLSQSGKDYHLSIHASGETVSQLFRLFRKRVNDKAQ